MKLHWRRADYVVDWDGTCVAEYREDGTPYWPDMGPWLPGAQEALRLLCLRGKVVIYSLRCHYYEEDDRTCRPQGASHAEALKIRAMLLEAGLDEISVYPPDRGKPPGKFYIDDRAVRFQGDWRATISEVLSRECP